MNRPVILIGNGIRSNPNILAHLLGLGIPILSSWMAADLLPEDSPVFCGRPGIYGQRAANIIIQKATHLYCYGARLDEQTVAYRYENFAPNAIKYVYDIDQAEIDKLPSNWISRNEIGNIVPGTLEWLAWCKGLYIRFRPELEGVNNQDSVDPFRFVSLWSDYAQPDDIIIAGAGKAGETLMQAFKVKAGQRVLTLSTNGFWQWFLMDMYWDVYISPEHDNPKSIKIKTLVTHIPNVTLCLILLVMYEDYAVFIALQTLALVGCSINTRMPAPWSREKRPPARREPSIFGACRAAADIFQVIRKMIPI